MLIIRLVMVHMGPKHTQYGQKTARLAPVLQNGLNVHVRPPKYLLLSQCSEHQPAVIETQAGLEAPLCWHSLLPLQPQLLVSPRWRVGGDQLVYVILCRFFGARGSFLFLGLQLFDRS